MPTIKQIIKFIRIWPVLLLLKIRVWQKDEYAMLWYDDLKRMGVKSSISLLTHRPYYINLLFHRIRIPYPSVSGFLFGSTPFFISPKIKIGGGVFLEHPYCSRLNCISIGSNLKCYHGVTFGDNGRGELPTIGNNVTCGCGCCIIGKIQVGNNVNIGAGTIITKNVPSNCTVVGNPAIIVRKDGLKVNIPL